MEEGKGDKKLPRKAVDMDGETGRRGPEAYCHCHS